MAPLAESLFTGDSIFAAFASWLRNCMVKNIFIISKSGDWLGSQWRIVTAVSHIR